MRRLVAVAVLASPALSAHLTRFVAEQRVPTPNGETISGHFFGELDPKNTHNSIINDLELAPRNARGMVEYAATFSIVLPSAGNGVLFYRVPNRGNGTASSAPEGSMGVVSGWQGDIAPKAGLQTIHVPIAHNTDGSPITGPVMERFIDMTPGTNTLPINTAQYVALTYQRPLTLDTTQASLTMSSGKRVAGADWAFADCTSVPFPGTPNPAKICLRNGFDPAYAYDLVFTARDPLVLGIGYAATRDLNSFLRYATKDSAGNANPVAGKVKWAIARGDSQSGNFIRSFIHLGFNQDEEGRIVWDGVNPHIAARQLALNFRFAVPGGAAGPFEPGSDGVLWWSDYKDTVRGHATAGLLDRCRATKTCPKILETFGGLEFWYLRESADLVGTDAKEDIPLPDNVRRYFFPGTSHGGGRGGFVVPPQPAKGCVMAANPNPETDTLNALTEALIAWVTQGTEPPASRYPMLRAGQLADPAKTEIGFPAIPGVPEPAVNPVYDYDFGPDFRANDLSGRITKQPPVIRQVIRTLVPKTDADGSDVGGVPSVLRQAPLGSYLGWNVTAGGFNKGKACGLSGGYIPFKRTRAERLAVNDPRLSLEERYGNHAGYVAKVKAAADAAVQERFLLPADAARLIHEAEQSDVLMNAQ